MIGVHAAVNHSNLAERIGVQEALELYTTNAARIGFTESDRGSLEAGKLGDFVVLAENPFQVEPARIKDIPVEMTVLGGEVVYQR
jgi:predicted amidohydrolase YtcJ